MFSIALRMLEVLDHSMDVTSGEQPDTNPG